MLQVWRALKVKNGGGNEQSKGKLIREMLRRLKINLGEL